MLVRSHPEGSHRSAGRLRMWRDDEVDQVAAARVVDEPDNVVIIAA
jgi:hypothetical protein